MPRALFIDLEPAVIDGIQAYKQCLFFHSEQLISRKEDATDHYKRSHYSVGSEIINLVQERIPKLTE